MTPVDMQPAFQASVAVSITAGLVISTAYFVAVWAFRRSRHHGESTYPEHRPAIIGPYVLFVAPAMLFCLLFPIGILVTATASGRSLSDLPSPPLLVCSLIVGGLGLARVLLAVFHRRLQWMRKLLSNQQLEELKLPDHVLPEALEVSFIGQYGFYGVVVATLWAFELVGQPDPLLVWIQLTLLFVADDWNIIAGYVSATRGRVRPLDKLRIVVTNLLLTGLLAVATIRAFGALSVVVLGGLGFSLLFGASYWFGLMKNFAQAKAAQTAR